MQKPFIQQLIYQYYLFLNLANNTKNFTTQGPCEKSYPLAIIGSVQIVDKVNYSGKVLYTPILFWNDQKLVIAIQSEDYKRKFAQSFSTIFRQPNKQTYKVMFTHLTPGFITVGLNTIFMFFLTSSSSLISISETLNSSIFNPLTANIFTQQYSQMELPQETVTVDYLKSKSSKVKFISGVVQIVKKRSIKVYDIKRNEYTLNVIQRNTGGKVLGVYKLRLDYNPKEEEDPIQNHYHYMFLNLSFKITDWGELVYTSQFTYRDFAKGLAPVYFLQKSPVVLPSLDRAITLSSISTIPKGILMRNMIKVKVMVTEFEIMVAKYVCGKCYDGLETQFCGICGMEGSLVLWSHCLAQDYYDSTPCLLKLEKQNCLALYELPNNILQKLTECAMKRGTLIIHLREKSKIPELMPLYFYLKFFTTEKTIVAVPYIDIYGTEKGGMDIEDRIDFQTGFMNKKEYHSKLKVNINGGFYEGREIIGLDVKKVYSYELK